MAAKTIRGGGFSLHIAGYWWVRWVANFTGIAYKRKIPHNDPWKWESVNYTGFTQYEGTLPSCTSASATASFIPIISADKRYFQISGSYNIILSWTFGINSEIENF
ncbi:MAG TPA: hypothetical protein PK987_04935 [Ferruginibacter sp.]|nr:hypothetical protein [Ferruginibacter sp.]